MPAGSDKRKNAPRQCPPTAAAGARRVGRRGLLVALGLAGALLAVFLLGRDGDLGPHVPTASSPAGQTDPTREEAPRESWGPAYAAQATAEELLVEARQIGRQVAAAYPDAPAALAVLARLQQALGESQPAADLWRKCVSLDPKYAAGYFGIGVVALRRGEFAEAVEALERAAALAPSDPRIAAALAAAWLGQGRVDETVAVLEKSAQLGPLAGDASIVLGQAYLQQGKPEPARRVFEKLVQQASPEAKAYYGLARACLQLGRSEEAQRHMQRFQELQGRRVEDELQTAHAFSDTAASRGLLVQTLQESAAVYAQAGDLQLAEQSWRGVARLESGHVAARRQLLRLYQSQERNREAVTIGEQLCELEPNAAEHWFAVAVLRGCLNEYEAALAAVEQAVKLEPDNPRYREARELIRKGKAG